ncbi:MAG: rhomboid family intramembrane serine protease, partial [Candidatus Latescibacterota bacterium]
MYFFYYVPVGINATIRRVPVLTYGYAGICLLVFVLNKYFAGQVPFDFYRLVYVPGDGNLLAAAAASFLHFGYFHLVGNLAYLLMFGRYVEDRMGPTLFSLIYFGTAFVGSLAQGLFNIHVLHDPYVGIVGASGAV